MREQALHVIGAILVTIIAVLGVLAACHMLISLPIPDGKGPEWIGAIGTIAAFAGTIWIATSESRARRRDAIDVAVLVCLEMSYELNWFISQIPGLIAALEMDDTPGTRESWKGTAEGFSKRYQWPDEKLAKLICVGDRTAERIALAKAHLANATNRMRTFSAVMGSSREQSTKMKCVVDLANAQNNISRAGEAMRLFVGKHRAD